MNIDSLTSSTQTRNTQSSNTLSGSTSFQDVLAKAAQAASTRGTSTSTAATAAEAKAKQEAADRAEYSKLQSALDDYMSKSPAEHMRDAILKEMGLTEEELNAKPPEERMALEEEINRRIKERLVGKQEGDSDEATLKAIEAAFRHPKTDDSKTSSDKASQPVNAAVIAQLMAQTSAASSL